MMYNVSNAKQKHMLLKAFGHLSSAVSSLW